MKTKTSYTNFNNIADKRLEPKVLRMVLRIPDFLVGDSLRGTILTSSFTPSNLTPEVSGLSTCFPGWFKFFRKVGTTFLLCINGGSSWRSSKARDLLNPDQANPVNHEKNNMDGMLALRIGDSLESSLV